MTKSKAPELTTGQTAWALVLLCALTALTAFVIVHLGLRANWGLYFLAVFISRPIGTVLHESGHVLAALALRRPVGEVRLFSGPVVVHFRLRDSIVRIGSWPFGGGKVWLRAGATLGRGEGVFFSASGPAVNVGLAAGALGFNEWSPTLLTAFFFSNALSAVASLIPLSVRPDDPNDGTKIFYRLGLLNRTEAGQVLGRAAKSVKVEDLPLELWTASADRALSVALQIAQAQGATQLGTEHLLAGVLHEPECPGARILADMGFAGERLLPLLVPDGATAAPAWSPEALMAVQVAIVAAEPELGVGTGELCLGVLAEKKGSGYAVLSQADITVGGFREQLDALRQREILVGCTRATYLLWKRRASARLAANRFADARADFIAMTPVAPDQHQRAVALNNGAWSALMTSNQAWSADALDCVRQALAIEPDEPAHRSTLAFALLETGEAAEAVAALDSFDDSAQPAGGQASNLCVRAMAAARLGDMEAAARHVRDAEALFPACTLLDRARAELEVTRT